MFNVNHSVQFALRQSAALLALGAIFPKEDKTLNASRADLARYVVTNLHYLRGDDFEFSCLDLKTRVEMSEQALKILADVGVWFTRSSVELASSSGPVDPDMDLLTARTGRLVALWALDLHELLWEVKPCVDAIDEDLKGIPFLAEGTLSDLKVGLGATDDLFEMYPHVSVDSIEFGRNLREHLRVNRDGSLCAWGGRLLHRVSLRGYEAGRSESIAKR